ADDHQTDVVLPYQRLDGRQNVIAARVVDDRQRLGGQAQLVADRDADAPASHVQPQRARGHRFPSKYALTNSSNSSERSTLRTRLRACLWLVMYVGSPDSK